MVYSLSSTKAFNKITNFSQSYINYRDPHLSEADLEGPCVPPFFAITFFCDHFEELQTVLIKVKPIINNALLT